MFTLVILQLYGLAQSDDINYKLYLFGHTVLYPVHAATIITKPLTQSSVSQTGCRKKKILNFVNQKHLRASLFRKCCIITMHVRIFYSLNHYVVY
jgi:hypothetical protein